MLLPRPDHGTKKIALQPDWYFENGLLAYATGYHLTRGYCSGSGCRHCPYEPRHVGGSRKVGA